MIVVAIAGLLVNGTVSMFEMAYVKLSPLAFVSWFRGKPGLLLGTRRESVMTVLLAVNNLSIVLMSAALFFVMDGFGLANSGVLSGLASAFAVTLFGELLPKHYAQAKPVSVGLALGRPFAFLTGLVTAARPDDGRRAGVPDGVKHTLDFTDAKESRLRVTRLLDALSEPVTRFASPLPAEPVAGGVRVEVSATVGAAVDAMRRADALSAVVVREGKAVGVLHARAVVDYVLGAEAPSVAG